MALTVSPQRRPLLAAVAVVLAVTCWLHRPIVVGAVTGEPRWFEWDVSEQYWPDLVYLCRGLHEGHVPKWNPWDRAGYPFAADPQAGVSYPLNWAICAVAGPEPGPGWATLRVLLGFSLAGLFGLGWLRRTGMDWGPATLGATVIQAAPFLRHNWELNLASAIAWLPAMLWAAESLARRRAPADAGWLALATALCVFVGSPPAAWMAGTLTALYLAARLAEQRGTAQRGRFAGGVTLAAALCVMMVAARLVPTATLAGLSVQAGSDYASISAGSLAPSDLLALVWPMPGNHLYVGLLPLLLLPLGLLHRDLPARGLLLVAWVLAVLLALGDHTPVFRLAFDHVPGVDRFRLPHRYEAWIGPAAGALAAGGLTEAVRRWPKLARAATLPGAAVLSLVLLVDVSRALPPERHTRAGDHPGLDLAALDKAPDTETRFRYLDEFGISCRSGTRLARRDLRGYQDPLQLAAFERTIASLRGHPRMAEQLSVKYALTGPHFIHGWDRHFLPPPDELLAIEGARDLGDGVIELPEPVPAAWFVPADRVEEVADRAAALERTRAVAPAMVAVLEAPLEPPLARGAGRAVPLELSLEPERVGIELPDDLPAGVVIVNDAWYPGWRAMVDHSPATVVRANGLVRAVPVPAGSTEVLMRYAPRWGTTLLVLQVLGWLGAIGLVVPRRRRTP